MTPEQHDPPPKYPHPGIKGPQQTEKPIVKGPVDGNAFAVMGHVIQALRAAGQADRITDYTAKATAGDYHNLLAVSIEFVEFDLDEHEEGG